METPPNPENFPPNPFNKREEPLKETKPVERITTSEPIRRKKSLGRKFKEMFIEGNLRDTRSWLGGLIVPSIRDMLLHLGHEGLEKYFRGESYKRRLDNRGSFIDYSATSRDRDRFRPPLSRSPWEPFRPVSPQSRARHDFDEIVLETRVEAEEVIQRMFDAVNQFESVSVADFYVTVGVRPSFVDQKWGWTDMRGAGVQRVREGYLLVLPDPQPLGM